MNKFLSTIAMMLILASLTMAADRMAVVDGYCFLQDQSDHSGSKVVFLADSPSAESDSVYTDQEGFFELGLEEGLYWVSYSHDGFSSYSIPNHVVITSHVTLPDVTLANMVEEVSGDVSGYWGMEHQTYYVIGDVIVPEGDSLFILPGTDVLFLDDTELWIDGYLEACGTQTDSIVFSSSSESPGPGIWEGLKFNRESSLGGGGKISYCLFEYASLHTATNYGGNYDSLLVENSASRFCVYGLIVGGDNLLVQRFQSRYCTYGAYLNLWGCEVSDCEFSFNSTGMFLEEGLATHNLIASNSGPGVTKIGGDLVGNSIVNNGGLGVSVSYAFGSIQGNRISSNQGGVGLYNQWGVVDIRENIIDGNIGAGVGTYEGPGLVLGNTIHGNGIGVVTGYAALEVLNNIISANQTGIDGGSYTDPTTTIMYNDIWGNTTMLEGELPAILGEIVTTNANGDSCDTYFNIFMDPSFVDTLDFELQSDSPCIDAGDPNPEYYDPDGTIADIGAKPFYQGNPLPPEIDFSPSVSSGHSPLSVELTSTNSGGPIFTWLWTFGDGSTSSRFDPVHTYSTDTPTFYTVSLFVEGPGGSDYVEYPDLIEVLPTEYPPIADFSADPLVGFGTVHFQDESSGQIDTYSWNFGDGFGTSTEQNPSYDYAVPGEYTVTLSVDGPNGSDIEIKENYITILEPDTVIAGFEPSADYGVVPATIHFTNTSFGTIKSYLWDFGDEGGSEEENPVHTYLEAGDFKVVLVASGPANADTATAIIAVLDPAPVIQSIEDVPVDQGLQVYLSFKRSGYDTDTPREAELYTVERKDGEVWTSVASGAAYGQDIYQFLVPTLVDSTDAGDGLTEFRVVAAMDEGNFLSAPAWGYSVDNIAPGPPGGFFIYIGDAANHLSWDLSDAPDFQFFSVYGGSSPDFEIGPENLLLMTAETHWIDSQHLPAFYKLTATDDGGNESPAVLAEETTEVPGEIPHRYALFPCMPNPFNPRTTIRYALPKAAEVTLEIINPSGRRVAGLVIGERRGAGLHEVIWDGVDDDNNRLASGVYLYRLRAGEFTQSRKLTLLK